MKLFGFFSILCLLTTGALASADQFIILEDGTRFEKLADGSYYSGEMRNGRPHGLGTTIEPRSKDVAVGNWSEGEREGIFLQASKVKPPTYRIYERNQLLFEQSIRHAGTTSANGYKTEAKGLRWLMYELSYDDGEINFYDDTSVVEKGSIKNVWELTDYAAPRTGEHDRGALSRLINFEFECVTREMRVVSAYWFSRRQRTGEVLRTSQVERESLPDSFWQGVIPGSVHESLFTRLCTR